MHQAEAGTSVAVIIRQRGITEQTFSRWKKCSVPEASTRLAAGPMGKPLTGVRGAKRNSFDKNS